MKWSYISDRRYLITSGGRGARTSVGISNRFRLSPWDALGKDLLATSQLLRSVRLGRVTCSVAERREQNEKTTSVVPRCEANINVRGASSLMY